MKRIILVLICLVLVFSFAACKPSQEELYTPGDYTHTVQGHNGEITVKTTLDKSRITKIEVLSNDETAGIGDTAMQQMVQEIIDKQSLEVDTVSGATYSSTALLHAVSLAVRDAGGEAPEINMDIFDKETGEPNSDGFPAPPYSPGEYSASAMGFGGDITVTVTVDEERVTAITAEGEKETDGIGTRAIDELPDALLEAGNDDVDAVSGATFTSNAIKTAFRDAVAQAK